MKNLIFVILFIAIIGCSVEKKAVVMEKCTRCGQIISTDTTLVYGKYTKDSKGQLIFSNSKDKRDVYIVNNKNSAIVTRCSYKLCEDCKKAKADSLVTIGIRNYKNNKNYYGVYQFREAEELGSEKAYSWLKKATEKQELESNLIAFGERHLRNQDLLLQWKNDIRYNTPRSEMRKEYAELEKWVRDEYAPTINTYHSYLSKYQKKCGGEALMELIRREGLR